MLRLVLATLPVTEVPAPLEFRALPEELPRIPELIVMKLGA